MKKIYSITILAIFAMLMGVACVPDKSDSINVSEAVVTESQPRLSAGVSAELSKVLSEATEVGVVEKKINTAPIVEAANPEPTIAVETVAVNQTMYIDNASYVNKRAESNTDCSVLATYCIGTSQFVLYDVVTYENGVEIDRWSAIEGGGYIKSKYLSTDSPVTSLGQYKLSHYCHCATCCGSAGKPTASGVMPKSGETVAADPSIPFGTQLVINGQIYTVQDRGVYGNQIDIFMDNHEAARIAGLKYAEVYIIN